MVMNKKPDPETSFIISLWSDCREFKVLPRSGGLLDQDAYYVLGMRLVDEAVAERDKHNANRPEGHKPQNKGQGGRPKRP